MNKITPKSDVAFRAEAVAQASTPRNAPAAPFAIRNLSVLAYANGFTLWHYKSRATMHAIGAPNYFSDAADMLSIADMILVSAGDGATVYVVADTGVDAVTTARMS